MGDDSLKGAAAYLGAMLNYAKLEFDYCSSNKIAKLKAGNYDLYILSDFPFSKLPDVSQKVIAESVKKGASLLMIGGWESFHGVNGEYQGSLIEEILPVICLTQDDRVNYCHGLVPVIKQQHQSIKSLPWHNPPVVCGFNKVKLKKDSQTVLALKKIVIKNLEISLDKNEFPLLVFGKYGLGKTCALTTDLAPHWVGGLVDWGNSRIKIRANGGVEVEVGSFYAVFVEQLIKSLVSK